MSDPAFISVDGIRLEVRRWPGKGSTILLLHEGLGSATMWRDFPQRLAAATQRPVIAWSRQGYGQSDPLPGSREPDYMHLEAAIVPRVMDALGLPSAHLLGHSDGASISLMVAARFPERVKSLVLEAPHVYVEALTVESIDKIRLVYEHGDLHVKLARYHARPADVFWSWNRIWLDPRFRQWNIEDFLPAVRAPILMIQCAGDEYGTADQLDRIAKIIPATHRLWLDGGGHAPHRDAPDSVVKATRDFLIAPD